MKTPKFIYRSVIGGYKEKIKRHSPKTYQEWVDLIIEYHNDPNTGDFPKKGEKVFIYLKI